MAEHHASRIANRCGLPPSAPTLAFYQSFRLIHLSEPYRIGGHRRGSIRQSGGES
jgi:hypothetical protein